MRFLRRALSCHSKATGGVYWLQRFAAMSSGSTSFARRDSASRAKIECRVRARFGTWSKNKSDFSSFPKKRPGQGPQIRWAVKSVAKEDLGSVHIMSDGINIDSFLFDQPWQKARSRTSNRHQRAENFCKSTAGSSQLTRSQRTATHWCLASHHGLTSQIARS